MKPNALLTRTAMLLACTTSLWLPVQASTAEPTALAALSGKQVLGSSLFRFWGFDVYQATLHAGSGFDAGRFEQQRLGLALQYRRAFKGADIAKRSIDEMQAIAALTPQQTTEWTAAMVRAFPDVKAGDELLGVHVPGSGARFYLNGQLRSTVDDPLFSARFFGIWLSPKTSAPQLRTALIAGAAR
ncbi:MAG: chalcone isomerase family protein [Hydrogenophaga sp.]|jgi:hypothetical protein|nr:chalcone isomerase family protein [Hydrogenophaga sp.]